MSGYDFIHDFPNWLQAALKAARLRPSDLARRTGLTKSHISSIIHGKASPTLVTVARIVDALNARLEEMR